MYLNLRFLYIILIVAACTTIAAAVPLAPETEAWLRATGQFDQVRDAIRDAHARGVDAPTTRPLNLKELRSQDRIELPVLVILVDFSDNQANQSAHPPSYYTQMLFTQGVYPTGSLRDYYRENSYNQVDIIGAAVGWYRMPHPYSYYLSGGNYGMGSYPNNAQKMTEDAVAAADPFVDFSVYDVDQDDYVDGLYIVHAGPGAEQTGNPNNIWSHAWVTSVPIPVDGVYAYSYSTEPENGNIGVFAHELGHALFGLPDLYDYGYDSQGTGMWSLMSGGSWGGGGTRPVHLDAWSKTTCGMAIWENVSANMTHVALPKVETNNVIYRLWTNGAYGMQYFLVENRRQFGFDQSLPGQGLLIYHIEEENGSNNNQWYPGHTSFGHYLVAVEQADGLWQLEHNSGSDAGDPWPGWTNHYTFNDTSIPDTKDYNFQPTMVSVTNISNSADTMYADLSVNIYVPNVTITTTPVNPPIVIPANGGSFQYTASLNNPGTAPQTCQVWNKVKNSSGFYFFVWGPKTATLPGGGTLNRTMQQTIAASLPAGQYSFISYVGNYPNIVSDSSFFSFTKSAQADGGPFIAAFSGSGDAFDEPNNTDVGAHGMRPERLTLHDVYPNPFNPTTAISYELQAASFVNLTVYDLAGKKVAELVNGVRDAGSHQVTFDGSNLAAGVYLYRLEAGGATAIGKMVLMK